MVCGSNYFGGVIIIPKEIYISLLKSCGICTLEDLINILDHSSDGIFITNSQGDFLYTNSRSVERISGIKQPTPFKNVNELIEAGIIVEESKYMLDNK